MPMFSLEQTESSLLLKIFAGVDMALFRASLVVPIPIMVVLDHHSYPDRYLLELPRDQFGLLLSMRFQVSLFSPPLLCFEKSLQLYHLDVVSRLSLLMGDDQMLENSQI